MQPKPRGSFDEGIRPSGYGQRMHPAASNHPPAASPAITPFTPSGLLYDSSMADGEGVEHTTSWLTINPIKGCSVGCAYCFRVRWGASDQPVSVRGVDELFEELVAHPDFVAHETPVSVNVSSTDAMLPSVRETTFRALELFEQRRLRNPFGLTTKLHIDDRYTARLAGLRYVRPIVFVSLAFLPWKAEPVPTRHRVANLRRLSAANVPVVLYFRPIVEGWNDSDRILERALRLGEQYCDAICIGGLRLSADIVANLVSRDALPPHMTGLGFHAKPLPTALRQRIDTLHQDRPGNVRRARRRWPTGAHRATDRRRVRRHTPDHLPPPPTPKSLNPPNR